MCFGVLWCTHDRTWLPPPIAILVAGLHRLPKHLQDGNSHGCILPSLVIHRFQRVLIGLHQFHAFLAHQRFLQEKADSKSRSSGTHQCASQTEALTRLYYPELYLCANQVWSLMGYAFLFVHFRQWFSAVCRCNGIGIKISHRHFLPDVSAQPFLDSFRYKTPSHESIAKHRNIMPDRSAPKLRQSSPAN